MRAELEFTIEIPQSQLDRTGSAIKLKIPDEYEFQYLRHNERLERLEPSSMVSRAGDVYEWKIPAPEPGKYTLVIDGPLTSDLLETIIKTDQKEGKTIRTKYINRIRVRYTPISDVETLIEEYPTTVDFDRRYLLTEVREVISALDSDEMELSNEWETINDGKMSFTVNSVTTSDNSTLAELVPAIRTRVNQGFVQEHIRITGDKLVFDDIDFNRNELGLPKSFSVTTIANLESGSVNTEEKVIFQKSEFWEEIDKIEKIAG
jgi:hypothetical protein